MGYTTKFTGELLFTKELKASELAELKKYLEEDCREHPEWNVKNLTYIDLVLNDDFSGIKWNGAEKTYDLTEKVNLIIKQMRNVYPDFGLVGELLAQGEEAGDVWILSVENNVAREKTIDLNKNKKKVTCPHCDEEFYLPSEDEKVFTFTGFRDDTLEAKILMAGHKLSDSFTKKTTDVVAKDLSKPTAKLDQAKNNNCTIWSATDLEKWLKEQTT